MLISPNQQREMAALNDHRAGLDFAAALGQLPQQTGYNYSQRRAIGRTADGVTPERVMAALTKTPNKFFPFQVVPVGAAASGVGIQLGGAYDLQDTRWISDKGNFVRVVETTTTSFTFMTTEGHFDGPGATIRFSTHEEGGVVYIQHDGNAPNAGMMNMMLADYLGGAGNTWDVQASNLSLGMSGAQPFRSDLMGAPY
jgi:hypothetical protein